MAVFDITKAKDSNGNVIEPVVSFSGGIIRYSVPTNLSPADMSLILDCSHAAPFKCVVKPRSPKAAELIVTNASELETRFVPVLVIFSSANDILTHHII